MLWKVTLNPRENAVINNYLRFLFIYYEKSLLNLFPNNLLDRLIEYDDTHNLINLLFFSWHWNRAYFPKSGNNHVNFPQKKG